MVSGKAVCIRLEKINIRILKLSYEIDSKIYGLLHIIENWMKEIFYIIFILFFHDYDEIDFIFTSIGNY